MEERNGKLSGYEFKFSPKKINAPAAWKKAYPGAAFKVIHKENFDGFILSGKKK